MKMIVGVVLLAIIVTIKIRISVISHSHQWILIQSNIFTIVFVTDNASNSNNSNWITVKIQNSVIYIRTNRYQYNIYYCVCDGVCSENFRLNYWAFRKQSIVVTYNWSNFSQKQFPSDIVMKAFETGKHCSANNSN